MADAIPQGWWSQATDPAVQKLLYQAQAGQLAPAAAYGILSQVSNQKYPGYPGYTPPAPFAPQAAEALGQFAPPTAYDVVNTGYDQGPGNIAAARAYDAANAAAPGGTNFLAMPGGQQLLADYPTQQAPDNFGLLQGLELFGPVLLSAGLGAAMAPATVGAEAGGTAAEAGATAADTAAAGGALAAPTAAGVAGGGASLADFSDAAQFAGGVGGGTAADVLAAGGAGVAPGITSVAAPAAIGAAAPSQFASTLAAQPSAAAPSTTGLATASGVPTASASDAASPAILSASSPAQLDQALQGIQPAMVSSSTPLDFTATSLSPTLNGVPVSGPPASVPDAGILGSAKSAFDTASAFYKAHPLLAGVGGTIAGQALSPVLSNLQGPTSQEKALLANAQGAINAQNSLIGSEASGVLPPGAETDIQNALNADKANIRQRYAQLGMTGSSAESQDLANADNQAAAQRFQFAQQATQTGAQLAGISDQVYETLLQDQLNRQAQLSNAFSSFMSSVGSASALGAALNRSAA